jgi:uncharacterized protein YecT (DUF1311 family)
MFSILLTAALGASAPQDPTTQSQWGDQEEGQCFDTAVTQSAMTHCASAAFDHADARMSAQWAKTSAAFKRVDSDSRAGPWPTKAFDSLVQGQRAWLTYREASCRGVGLIYAGGSIAPMNELLCRAAITDTRTKELLLLSQNPNSDEPL